MSGETAGAARRRREHQRVLFMTWRDDRHPLAGGSERTLLHMSTGLARRGHRVTVFTARYPGSAGDEMRDGVRYRRRGGRLTVYLWGLLHLATRSYDSVVDVQNGIPFFSVLLKPNRSNLLVHHVHREQWPVATGWLTSRIGWFLESRVSPWLYRGVPVAAMSRATEHELIELGFPPRNLRVIRNGSLPPHCEPDPAPSPLLVVVSRLVPHKQVDHAIRVLAALIRDHPDLTLVVVGVGYDDARLRLLADELGVTGTVRFVGFVDDREKFGHLSRAWVHLFPSLKEGWGLVAVESASVGVPTLAYASAGGVNESVLHGETGFLVADLDELIAVTDQILTDADLRTRLRTSCLSHGSTASWESTVDQIEAMLLGDEHAPAVPSKPPQVAQ